MLTALLLLAFMLPGRAVEPIEESIESGSLTFDRQNFAEWCQHRAQLSSADQLLVEALLNISEESNCAAAATKLQSQKALFLSDASLSSINPLVALPQLETLYLDNNQIRDLRPLAAIANLKELYLSDNEIADIATLAELTALTHLSLYNNRVSDIAALSALTNLRELYVSANNIERLDDLTALTQLTMLDARTNRLLSKTCPVLPATICKFSDGAAALSKQGEDLLKNQPTEALQVFQSALAVYQQEGDRLRESDVLNSVGKAYDGLGQYANALAAYEQAAEIRPAIAGRARQVETLTNLGITYLRIGQMQRARDILLEALTIQQQRLAAGEPSDQEKAKAREADMYDALALVYGKLGYVQSALAYAKQSLARYRWLNSFVGEAIALNRVGAAYLQTGDLMKALLYLNKARDLSLRENLGASLARSFYNLGDVVAKEQNTDLALDYYQQAQAQWQQQGDPAGEGEALNAMGAMHLKLGEMEKATARLQAALALWQRLPAGLTDENKISIAETQANTYRMLQQALIAQQKESDALEISESGRARAFAELLAHRLTLQGKSVPETDLRSPSIELIKAIAHAQNASLIEYSIVNKDLYIWVVKPTGEIYFRQSELTSQSLQTQVADSRQAIDVKPRGDGVQVAINPKDFEFDAVRQQLYQVLIEPIEDVLSVDETLIIIPQSELFLVPFPALQDDKKTDLIQQHPLAFSVAIGLLDSERSSHSSLVINESPTLVVGDPVMPLHPTTKKPFSDLGGTKIEAEVIAEKLGTTPLLQDRATKENILPRMQAATVMHFATHGLLDDFGTGIPGALTLSPTPTDSGFLTTSELLELPMVARLVVLSACNTGEGDITGDGVMGLSRAFLTAGVESVVVSLWKVDDDATVPLMEAFYEQLESGEANRAIALQKAMLKKRSELNKPAQWAAFALFGDVGEQSFQH